MSLLESLKKIVGVDINLSNFRLVNITIVNQPTESRKGFTSDEGKIVVNYPKLSEQEWKSLAPEIVRSFDAEEIDAVIEKNAGERIRDIKEKADFSSTKELLAFYKPLISSEHYAALEAAVYIREIYVAGGSVSELKQDLVKRLGPIGRNITNLCTAGYFDDYFRKLYDEMDGDEQSKKAKYKEHFEKLVAVSPFAIFVHAGMSENELVMAYRAKLDQHERYGIKFLNIHGIGRENVSKILPLTEKLIAEGKPTSIKQDGNVILLAISLD